MLLIGVVDPALDGLEGDEGILDEVGWGDGNWATEDGEGGEGVPERGVDCSVLRRVGVGVVVLIGGKRMPVRVVGNSGGKTRCVEPPCAAATPSEALADDVVCGTGDDAGADGDGLRGRG